MQLAVCGEMCLSNVSDNKQIETMNTAYAWKRGPFWQDTLDIWIT